MIAWILLFSIVFLLIRDVFLLSKNNSGSIKCSTIYGVLVAHNFVEFMGDRVCLICGLVQKEEHAGILTSDGDAWYDKGYAEDKYEMVNHIQNQKNVWDQKRETRKQDDLKQIRAKRIKTPKEVA